MENVTPYKEIHSFRHRLRLALLRKGELEFRRLLEKLPAGAYTCNPEGFLTYFNRQAVQLWGRTPTLNIDRYCGSFKLLSTDGSLIPHDQCWMALALKEQKEYNSREIVIEKPNGDRITVLVHANPIYDDSGKVIGGVNVLIDITDRKRAEEALKHADKAKNQFLAVLAHELRNPLAPITNAVEILREKRSLDPDEQRAMEVIDRQVGQMARLIDDLLDVARITANKLELRKSDIPLSLIIDSALEISKPVLAHRNIDLRVKFPKDALYTNGDLTRLAQAISNLLNNAAKYTLDGGKVFLQADRLDNKLRITVTDTGIGIPSDALPHVFEMFTQANNAKHQCPGGLGIGLTLVKQLVEMHGGTVNAFSDGPGKGSTFAIFLPIKDAPEINEFQEQEKMKPEFRLHPFRIVVIEDNLISAEMLATMLKQKGCEVQTAPDGEEGLKTTQDFKPDIVLLDVGLPGISGYDVARRIRQHDWGSGITLIAVTGWGEDEQKLRCAEAGIDYHLVKPVHPNDLLQIIGSIKPNRC